MQALLCIKASINKFHNFYCCVYTDWIVIIEYPTAAEMLHTIQFLNLLESVGWVVNSSLPFISVEQLLLRGVGERIKINPLNSGSFSTQC